MDKELLQEMVENGYVNVQKHPTEDLYIYNYSKGAQYEEVWNEITIQCRGLIMDGQGNILARPFKKFFNWEQHDSSEIPASSFVAYEKMDGCLGILYWDSSGEPWLATRGSFISDQSQVANKILRENPEMLDWARNKADKGRTYCFEIIHPNYRIVVDYGGKKDLVLLGIIDTETGEDVPFPEAHPFTQVKILSGISDFHEIKSLNIDNKEGFVLRFECGFRMKIKFEEYCRLHSILTNVSTKTIWRCLREGTDFSNILEDVPDEFYSWVEGKKLYLENKFAKIKKRAQAEALSVIETFTEMEISIEEIMTTRRKELFERVSVNCTDPHLVLGLFDGKIWRVDEKIWKSIEPKFETPFLAGEEG